MDFLLYLATVPSLGFAAQWIAWRTNLPSILLLLLFGLVLGQFAQTDQLLANLLGGDPANGPALLFPLVTIAVAVIMFEGGLSLDIQELRESGGAVIRLCTLGALLTWVSAALAAHWILRFEWRLSALLGAILVVTGPTVIGPLLRQVRPHRRVATTLKWEGIVIDPIGAILTVLVFEQLMVIQWPNALGAIGLLLKSATVGTVAGVLGGIALTSAFRKFLVPDNLQGVCTLSVGLLLFALSNHLVEESGLITVTVMGIWLSNQPYFDVEHIIEFKENLRTLLIGCLFIVLGSRVGISEILEIGLPGILFLLVLILLVRPVSVFIGLWGTSFTLREKTFIAAMAPRGIVAAAVSSAFALKMEPIAASLGIQQANQLDTVTFLVIVGTVTTYGLIASPLAQRLGLADTNPNGLLIAGAEPWIRDFARALVEAGIPVRLVDTNFNNVAMAKMAGLEAICGNILNEHVRDELPLEGIGKMLAMTSNDEVNSLAMREYRARFDRSQLFQLSFNNEKLNHRRGLTSNLMGRELFAKGLTHSLIRDRHVRGAVFKVTTLSDRFTYKDFQSRHGARATLFCILDTNQKLSMATTEQSLTPVPGDRLIAMIEPSPGELTGDLA